MWADSILIAERHYVARTLAWAGMSIIAATAIMAVLAVRRIKSPVLSQFALQLAGWGLVLAAIAAVEWQGLHVRDLASATRLERATWARVGFDVGLVGVGGVLAAASRAFGRRLGGMGAGAGIALQGLALLVLDLQFVEVISR